MLESIGVPLDKLKFVRGTDYQLSRQVSAHVARYDTTCAFCMYDTVHAFEESEGDVCVICAYMYTFFYFLLESIH